MRVVRTGRGFGMILHAEEGQGTMPHCLRPRRNSRNGPQSSRTIGGNWRSRLLGRIIGTGIAAYRENVAIYRKVIERNQTLTYDDALRLMRNEWLTMRLALARAVEERLRSNDALAPSNVGGWDQADANRLRPRLEIEVINRIDSDVKTADDLEASDKKLREIAKIDASTLPDKVLGDYVKAITELTIQIELWAAAYTLR